MLFLGKENIFKCFVAFQKMFWKIFSRVWLCSWKYHRKHIFYLLLTFSHIFSAAKQIYNIIPHYKNTKETKPKKKIHQIRSNWEKKEEREATGLRRGRAAEATGFDLEARSQGGGEGEHDQTGFIGDGFEVARSNQQSRGSRTRSGLHWR